MFTDLQKTSDHDPTRVSNLRPSPPSFPLQRPIISLSHSAFTITSHLTALIHSGFYRLPPDLCSKFITRPGQAKHKPVKMLSPARAMLVDSFSRQAQSRTLAFTFHLLHLSLSMFLASSLRPAHPNHPSPASRPLTFPIAFAVSEAPTRKSMSLFRSQHQTSTEPSEASRS